MTMTGKKTATLWLAVAVAIAFLMISGAKTVYAITQIDSGPINSTCIWDYWQEDDGTDVLSIVSTDNDGGRMDDYTYAPPYDSTAPWAKYRDQIDEIRFQDIVEVGNHAFYGYPRLKSIYINGARRIGDAAFEFCTNVESIIVIGDNCVIEDDAFAFCEDKTMKIVRLDGVKSIGESAFAEVDCGELQLTEGLESIGMGAFNNNEAVVTLTIPKSCHSIGDNAFAACKKLKEVVLLNPLCTFERYSFDKDYLETLWVKKDSTAISLAAEFGIPCDIYGNVGAGTIDLTKGAVTLKYATTKDPGFCSASTTEMLGMTGKVTLIPGNESGLAFLDLDQDGTGDVSMEVDIANKILVLSVHPNRSVGGNVVFTFTQKEIDEYESYYSAPFYSTLTLKLPELVKSITPTVTLAASDYAWDGKVKTPAVVVKDGSTTLAASDYTVTYDPGRKNVGTYNVKVTLKGKYAGSKVVSFRINPKKASLTKLSGAKKAITVKWKKQSAKMSSARITGYQIQLATNSKFTKNKKLVKVKGYKKVSKKVKGLKGGKKYYVRIRTYKTISGTTYYSPWSKAKKVKTKK